MKRIFDVFFASLLLIIFVVPLLLISIIIASTSGGPILHWSRRIGKNKKIFLMPKFRTMSTDTPDVPTHQLEDPTQYTTSIGGFLRRSSLDELPQLFSVFRGDMSFVGPRPALHSQIDLIELREKAGVTNLTPGITGWAQVNGRDLLSIEDKVIFDLEYKQNMSFWSDLKIILKTAEKVLMKDGVSH